MLYHLRVQADAVVAVVVVDVVGFVIDCHHHNDIVKGSEGIKDTGYAAAIIGSNDTP